MSIQYNRIPTSAKKLCDEMGRLVDLYSNTSITEDELQDALKTWASNVPHLLFGQSSGTPEGDQKKVCPRVEKYVGKRRAMIVNTLLKKLSEN